MILKKIAHFQIKHPYISIMLILSLTLIMIGGSGQVKTVASLEKMMPPKLEEIRSFNNLRDQGMGKDSLGIIIELNRESNIEGIINIKDEETALYIKKLTNMLNKQREIISISKPEFDSAKTQAFILLTTDIGTEDEKMRSLSEDLKTSIDNLGHPPNIKIKLTGTPIIQQKLGELISSDQTNTRWISTIFVFIIIAILFNTISGALIPIIIVTISVTWLYGTMGYFNLPISTIAGGVAAMVIGIGIDFAIHIMNKFKFERKEGNSIENSIEKSVTSTGIALIATSLTTISAFLAFLIGSMPEMGRFGILMALGITYSLIFSIFGLPALLIIEENLIKWIKNNMKFGIESEYELKEVENVR